jgi:hypothetical protein
MCDMKAVRLNADTGPASLSIDWRLLHGRIAQAGSKTDLKVNECAYLKVGRWQQCLAKLQGQCTESSYHETATG